MLLVGFTVLVLYNYSTSQGRCHLFSAFWFLFFFNIHFCFVAFFSYYFLPCSSLFLHLKCLLTHPPFNLITSEVFIEVIILVFCQSVSIFLSIPAVITCSYSPPPILPSWTPSWNLQCNSGTTCGQFFFARVIEVAETGCRMWVPMSNVTTSDTWSCEFLANIDAVKPTSTEKHVKPFYWGCAVSVAW